MVSFETSDLRKIGQGLVTFGGIFKLIGIILFFDKGFLAVGNILILSGLILAVGTNFFQFFLNPKNFKVSIPLVVGFIFVIIGWPLPGLFLEDCGFVFLLWEFWPTVANFLRNLPILGTLLRQFYTPPYFAPSRRTRCPV